MDVDEFWRPFEKEVASFEEASELIHDVFEDWSAGGAMFAWRGQVDASWPLHSLLYRRLLWTTTGADPNANAPGEAQLQEEERAILKEVHRWGLHVGAHGRLSALSQLAVLQHYGAPTRLVDVAFNPLVGLWFAVEEQWENGVLKNEDKDGRLFAIDVSSRLINEDSELRAWEDNLHRPWPRPEGPRFDEWTTKVLAWKPARLDHRIAAQNGGFLLGGIPSSGAQWLKDSANPAVYWGNDDVRRSLSIPVHFHKIDRVAGRLPDNPAYTIRIKSAAKADIRKHLQDLYGYRHATIYPDYQGFALFGRPNLRTRPPA